MQIKKDELYQTLLANAEKEFLEKGFSAGSLRGIAKASGTTIGNLYHYFESKEALFEALVRDEYERFKLFIGNHAQFVGSQEVSDSAEPQIWRKLLTQYVKSLSPIFTKRFYLLVNRSEGTRFEGAKAELLKIMEGHLMEHLQGCKWSEELGAILSKQLLLSILNIIRDYEDDAKKTELIVEVILFTLAGVAGILQNSPN